MHAFARLPLRTKALIAPMLFLIAGIGLSAFAVQAYQASVIQQRKEMLRAVVETAMSTIAYFFDAEQSGAMTHDAATAAAKNAIGHIRFGKGDYVVLLSDDGRYLYHPNLSWVDVPNEKLPPSSVATLRRDLALSAVPGGAFDQIEAPLGGTGKLIPKIVFASKFVPWKWSLTAAASIEGIYADIHAYEINLGLVTMASVLIAGFVSWFVMTEFNNALKRVVAGMDRIALGNLDAKIVDGSRRDEAGTVARTLETFRARLIEAGKLRGQAAEAQAAAEAAQLSSEAERAARARALQHVVDGLATALSQLDRGRSDLHD